MSSIQIRKEKSHWGREILLLLVVLIGAFFLIRGALGVYYTNVYPMKYTQIIDKACEEKGLDRALVYAIVHTESGFRPDAVSGVGAKGLMQMMPDAFDWVRMRKGEEGESDYALLFDPEVNVEYGTTMLRLLLDEFGSVENALCAYHAGWGSVTRWLQDEAYSKDGLTISHIPFEDTRAYVAKVLKTAEQYRKLYHL